VGGLRHARYVRRRRTRDRRSRVGREPYGDGVPIVVVGVTSHQGDRESRSQGEGAQVIVTSSERGMRNADRRNGAGCHPEARSLTASGTITGEPGAGKLARRDREGADGKGPTGTSPAAYFTREGAAGKGPGGTSPAAYFTRWGVAGNGSCGLRRSTRRTGNRRNSLVSPMPVRAPAASPTNSIKRPRNARAVTLPGGRGGRSGRLQAAARRQERRGFGAAQFETAVRSRTVVVGQELLDHCLQVAGAEDPSVHHPLRDDHKPPRGLQGGVDQVADARRALSTDSSGRPELNLPRTSQQGRYVDDHDLWALSNVLRP
jgi:hypothetical protein